MRVDFRKVIGRSLCALVPLAWLLAAIPGCGDAPKSSDATGGVAPVVKESNDNMENFMKSQKAKKK